MELLGRLRRAVKKLTFLINLSKYLTTSTWHVATMIKARAPAAIKGAHHSWRRRALSFDDRPGLRACVVEVLIVDENENDGGSSPSYDGDDERVEVFSSGASSSPSPLRRTTSYPLEQDVDKQAEMFIESFYRHLVYEKQVSLNLRYCQDYNSFDSSIEDSVVSPLSSSSGSRLVSPI